ncbi:heptaprenyl diphosphate synthase component 1 [Anaerobacillus sp. MEB173]|uniref:heptaprenyl diphosphate synthase component 1 n=1 Tax=Anaerobacillus sp. MEB173 TaxID=3383345 RepID=UPI003F8FC5E2
MTTVKDYSNEIIQLKDRLYKRLQHPYLMKFIDPPFVDDDKFFFLYTMLQDNEESKECIKEYVLTTMLVQAALDTHEKVSLSTISTNVIKKHRQLTVLAGDYYSSLYYYLLSKIDDITMIRILALSIKEINESKMSFYKNDQSLHESFNNIRMIETDLLQKVADHYNISNWKSILGEFFLLKRLLGERKQLAIGHYGPLMSKISQEHFGQQRRKKTHLFQQEQFDQLLQMCDVYIERSRETLLNQLHPYQSLHSYIHERVEQLFVEAGLIKEKVAEEG